MFVSLSFALFSVHWSVFFEQVVGLKFADAMASTIRADDQFYCRFTTAIDSQMMEGIFAAVRNDITQNYINSGQWIM